MYNNKRSKVRKRKTRKCLDEMRKKSLYLETTDRSTTHSTKSPGKCKSKSVPKNITSDRLTMKLGMFAKGVRSETITRPMHVSEEFKARMDQNLYKIIDLANGKPVHTVTSGAYEKLFKEIRKTDLVQDGDIEVIIEEGIENIAQQNRHNDIAVHAPPSTCLPADCSPPNQVKGMKCVAQKEWSELKIDSSEEENSIKDSQESLAECDEEEYRQFNKNYRNFIDEVIPAYLSHNVKRLMNDDAIIYTKTFLQDVFKKNCNADSDFMPDSPPQKKKKMSNIIEQTMKESILLNPIDYIKQKAKHGASHCDLEIMKMKPTFIENPQNNFIPKTNFSANLTWDGTQYIDSLSLNRIPNYTTTENILEESENEVVNLKISLTPEETQSWNASSGSDGSCDSVNYKEPSFIYCFPRKLNP